MTEKEIEAMKKNIEKQITERAAAINAADKWFQAWKARQPTGFRIKPAAYRQQGGVTHELRRPSSSD
jgi:hypothetical protein